MSAAEGTLDAGSGLLGQEAVFQIDSNKLDIGSYEYLCIVHPWMVSSIIIDEPVE